MFQSAAEAGAGFTHQILMLRLGDGDIVGQIRAEVDILMRSML